MADAALRVVELLGNAIVGGMETSVRRLLKHLPSDEFRIRAILPREGACARGLRDDGHEVAIVPLLDDTGWTSIHAVAGHIEQFGADLVHAHLPNAHMVAALAGALTATPVAATIHAMHLSCVDLEAHRLCQSDLVFVSKAGAVHARAVGVESSHVHVVRNAAPPPAAPRRGAASRREGSRVAWIGRLSVEKNPGLLLDAIARMSDVPDLAVTVIGDGPLRSTLLDRARELGVDARVVWLGEVEDASARLNGYDVLVSTSHHEGTPLVVLEAIEAGVPVVATAVGGVPEIVASGEDGWLVASGDAHALEKALRSLCPTAAEYRPLALREGRSESRGFDRYLRQSSAALRVAAGRSMRAPPYRRSAGSVPGESPATTNSISSATPTG